MFSRFLNKVPISGSIDSWSFHDDNFSTATKDMTFASQMSQPDIEKIMPHMLVVAKVCGKIPKIFYSCSLRPKHSYRTSVLLSGFYCSHRDHSKLSRVLNKNAGLSGLECHTSQNTVEIEAGGTMIADTLYEHR